MTTKIYIYTYKIAAAGDLDGSSRYLDIHAYAHAHAHTTGGAHGRELAAASDIAPFGSI